jgi:transposase-like protein
MEERTCVLVVIGANEVGQKELVALEDGYRVSGRSQKEVLLDVKRCGLSEEPLCAMGDGTLGYREALIQVHCKTRSTLWIHRTGNVLNELPKSVQNKAKDDLHEIWMRDTREDAEKAFDHFHNKYQAK